MSRPRNRGTKSNHLSRNEQFLRKVKETVESNLENEHFGVEDLADAMSLSRIQLYRKLHKLTGKNISQYIREIRLDRAMKMLQEDVASVSEIAYQVGFGSPAYFNKCFHEYYGYPPGEVIKLSLQGALESEDSAGRKKTKTNQYNVFGFPRRNWLRSRKAGLIVAILTGTIILLAVSVYLFKNFRDGSFMLSNHEKSIAVLPFRNDSPDPDNAYFCNGMADEIITILQKIQDLQVISRTSNESYRNREKDFTQIARALKVNYILEGSVRKSGNDLRIFLHLIDGKTGEDLWAETYDGKYNEEIFRFQQKIALEIAGILNAVVTPEENRKLATPPTIDLTAYDYTLRAREEQWKFWFFDDTIAHKNADRLYDKAIQLDPNYARGWAGKGGIYYDLHVQSEEYYENNYLDSVFWYAEKARQLDPKSLTSFQLKAMVYHRRGDIRSAIHYYEEVIKNSSGENFDAAEAMWRLGFIDIYSKDYQKGISLIRRAVQTARGSTRDYSNILFRLAYAYLWIGEYERAEKCFIHSWDMGSWFLGYPYLYYYQGDFQAALDCLLDHIPDPSKDWDLYLLGNIYFQLTDFKTAEIYYKQFREIRKARGFIQWDNLYREGVALVELGRKEEGIKLIEEQLAQLEKRKDLGRPDAYDYHLAAIYAYRGDPEKAMQYLRDYEQKVFYPDLCSIIPLYFAQYDVLFQPLWDNPEFKRFLKQDYDEKEAGRILVREMYE